LHKFVDAMYRLQRHATRIAMHSRRCFVKQDMIPGANAMY